jgi:hypothetical protein
MLLSVQGITYLARFMVERTDTERSRTLPKQVVASVIHAEYMQMALLR